MKLRISNHRLQYEMIDDQEPDGIDLRIHNLPENYTIITDELFRGNERLKTMTVVSPHVKQIHLNAFEGCTELTELQLSPSVKYIEANAFAGCDKLEKVILDESIDRVDYRFSAAVKATEHKPFPNLVTNLKKGIPVELHEWGYRSWDDWN